MLLPPDPSTTLRVVFLTVMLTACAGETIEPGRSPNHPANPSTTEAPFSLAPNALAGEGAPATAPPPAASGMPGMNMPSMPGMDMSGMSGMPGMSGMKDAGTQKAPADAK